MLPGLFIFGAGYDFGQRETLMAACALPYVLAAARRARGGRPRARIASALLAAVGFALKPYFLAIPGAGGARRRIARQCATWRDHLRDPVPWTMAAVWLVYLASLPLLFPAYLGTVVPLVWGFYLEPRRHDPAHRAAEAAHDHRARAVPPLLPLAARRDRGGAAAHAGARRARRAGLGDGAAQGLVVSTSRPIELFATALGTVLAARWFDRIGVAAPAIPAVLVGPRVPLCARQRGAARRRRSATPDSETAALVRELRPQAEGGRVLVMSPNISPIFPALNYLHAKLTLR